MKQDLYFAGTWLSELGGRLNELPKIEIAERDCEFVEIPGRSGDIFIDNNRYKNVDFSRKITLINRTNRTRIFPTREQIEKAIFSFSKIGYQEFRDTQHLGAFTKAVLLNFSDVSRELPMLSTATLQFNRIPYWFSDEGQQWIYMEDDATHTIRVYNPYPFTAEADYYITCSGGTTDITIGGITYKDIDFDIYSTLYINNTNKQIIGFTPNTRITRNLSGSFPAELTSGYNTINIIISNSEVTLKSARVRPNWRFL